MEEAREAAQMEDGDRDGHPVQRRGDDFVPKGVDRRTGLWATRHRLRSISRISRVERPLPPSSLRGTRRTRAQGLVHRAARMTGDALITGASNRAGKMRRGAHRLLRQPGGFEGFIPGKEVTVLADLADRPGLGALSGVEGTDAIIATPSPTKMPQITFVAGNFNPGVYFDACNPTAAPIDPQPFTVRVNTVGA